MLPPAARTPQGLSILALAAGPPSPPNPYPETTVVIICAGLTTRIALLMDIYRLPAASSESPVGPFTIAAVAGPPSPQFPPVSPVPAYVLMTPFGATLRTRLFT